MIGDVILIDLPGTRDTNGVLDAVICQNIIMSIFEGNMLDLEIDGLIYFQPVIGKFYYFIDKKLAQNLFCMDDEDPLVLLTHFEQAKDPQKHLEDYKKSYGLKFLG